MLTKDIQDFLYRTAFLRAGIKLAVRIGTGATLTKAVVAVFIYNMFARDTGNVLFAIMNVLSAFHHDGAQAQLYQSQRRKQTAGACSDDNHLGPSFHIGVVNLLENLL